MKQKSTKDLLCLCNSSSYVKAFEGNGFELLKCGKCGLSRINLKYKLKASSPKNAGSVVRNSGMERLWKKFAAAMLHEVSKFKKSGWLLDVGCGEGVMLDYARGKGFQVLGIELNQRKAEYGRRFLSLDIRTEDFMRYGFNKKFDVVIANHVIEHFDNPLKFLSRVKGILKDDGILAIGTPNVDGWIRSILGEKWYPYSPGEHIYIYNERTLSKLLEDAGFKVLRMKVNHNHYGGKAVVLTPLLFLLEILGLGDNIIVIAQRGGKNA